jgi:hypothetical protein
MRWVLRQLNKNLKGLTYDEICHRLFYGNYLSAIDGDDIVFTNKKGIQVRLNKEKMTVIVGMKE